MVVVESEVCADRDHLLCFELLRQYACVGADAYTTHMIATVVALGLALSRMEVSSEL